ncbi:hypothetical protein [Sedimenticola selenatireducens]|uniref:hypothetical protein n=1 Tax=Sedimenticola selenatireducens TaxID=191960 RepID=UPI002AAB8277|nr:hypothetical protein [Sedimenticola selenatireducens]
MNKRPVIGSLIIERVEPDTRESEWIDGRLFDFMPDIDDGVEEFFLAVDGLARRILREFEVTENTINTPFHRAYEYGASPEATETLRSYPGETVPAELTTAVELLGLADMALQCLVDGNAAEAVICAVKTQKLLDLPHTVTIRNKIIANKRSPNHRQAKAVAKAFFDQQKQAGEKENWKIISRHLESKGLPIADGTIRNWLVEFRKSLP